jgi:hypothetical protein
MSDTMTYALELQRLFGQFGGSQLTHFTQCRRSCKIVLSPFGTVRAGLDEIDTAMSATARFTQTPTTTHGLWN